jgi:hypothetical protein
MMSINSIKKIVLNQNRPHIAEFTIIQEQRFLKIKLIILEIRSLKPLLSFQVGFLTQAQSITMDQYLILEL